MFKKDKENTKVDNSKLSLNDDRRVKTLSPSALVAKRFFRNKVAVAGLIILIAMFVFSFGGALVTPYAEDQTFTTIQEIRQPIGGAKELTELSFTSASGSVKSTYTVPARRAITAGQTTFTASSQTYTIEATGDFYEIYDADNNLFFIAFKNSVNMIDSSKTLTFELRRQALKAYELKPTSFTVDGEEYYMDEEGTVVKGGEDYAFVLSYSINAIEQDVFFARDFMQEAIYAIENGEMLPGNEKEFTYTPEGETSPITYFLIFDGAKKSWEIKEYRKTLVYDTYSYPSGEHWLGTESHGMDMLTRLMYGGRVSLLVGFIVVIIEIVLGVIMGGISGYFGGWVDNLIMRIVDILYCIPSTPLLIILGAAMDALSVDPTLRMVYLMVTLGILGWPGVARLVRGQILSLREQEFMLATEACGISVKRRIFRHLIPNVIPQLIVTATMGLGSTIITEATLSFLGLGVRFPFASWGNIINDVNDINVLTNYLFVWIPAGVCIVLTVLAFNLVGDGLRDAFDPKMKR